MANNQELLKQKQSRADCKLRLWYCDHYEFPLPPGHRFPGSKYRLLRKELAGDPRFTLEPAPLADVDSVCLVHERRYVEDFVADSLDARAMRRIGFPWSPQLVARTLASVGATLEAARDALRTGWGGTLAGGTHHAFRDEGSGFCVFNDVAVAIRALGIERAAVLDLDVHQGDGTALIFAEDPRVLTISLHGQNNFPFRKQASCIDISFPDGTGDGEYLTALREVLPRVSAFSPEAIFYQSGVDGLAGDKLGRLALTHEGLAERDRLVFEFCRRHSYPCTITLGGGYSEPIHGTVRAHAATFRLAAAYQTIS